MCRHHALSLAVAFLAALGRLTSREGLHDIPGWAFNGHLSRTYLPFNHGDHPAPYNGRHMERYSLEKPTSKQHEAEETPGSRRAGIVLATVGVLMMALAVLGGWSPWSL